MRRIAFAALLLSACNDVRLVGPPDGPALIATTAPTPEAAPTPVTAVEYSTEPFACGTADNEGWEDRDGDTIPDHVCHWTCATHQFNPPGGNAQPDHVDVIRYEATGFIGWYVAASCGDHQW